MKKWMFLPVAIVLVGCSADASLPSHGAAAAPTGAAQERPDVGTAIPAHFSEYAAAPISEGRRCVVGAVTDEDGMEQKPVLYVSDAANAVLWSRALPLPPNTYQSRATHCVGAEDAIYVLLQSDTRPEQTLSQTLLRVVKVDPRSGGLVNSEEVAPPGISDAYSAWVEEGGDKVQLQEAALVITGNYYRLAEPEAHMPFQASVGR